MPPRCLSHSLVAFSAPYVVTFSSPYSCHYHSSLAALSTLFWLSVLVRGFHYSLTVSTVPSRLSLFYQGFHYSLVAFHCALTGLVGAVASPLCVLLFSRRLHYSLAAIFAACAVPSRLSLPPRGVRHDFQCSSSYSLAAFIAPSRLSSRLFPYSS